MKFFDKAGGIDTTNLLSWWTKIQTTDWLFRTLFGRIKQNKEIVRSFLAQLLFVVWFREKSIFTIARNSFVKWTYLFFAPWFSSWHLFLCYRFPWKKLEVPQKYYFLSLYLSLKNNFGKTFKMYKKSQLLLSRSIVE